MKSVLIDDELTGRSGILVDVVDEIYEAALVPEKWVAVLDRISSEVGSVGGALLATGDRYPPRWAASECIAPALRAYTAGDAWKSNSRPQQVLSSNSGGFSRDVDLWSAEELDRYRVSDERSQHGLGWQLGSIIPMTSGETVIFTFDRRFEDGPHDLAMRDVADLIRPHLARAGLLAARLGLERARTMVATLAAIELPAAVLTASGRVLAANELLQDLDSVFVETAQGGLAIADTSAQHLFEQAVIENHRAALEVRSIPVAAKNDRPPIIVHVLPVRGDAHDLLSGADILVVAAPIRVDRAMPHPHILQGLFDLSPKEAQLALALMAGEPLKNIAVKHGIRFSTARSYLERIFSKTGTHQQSQLVALLKSVRL